MSLIAAGEAATRVAPQARGASGALGCAITTRSVAPSAGNAAVSAAVTRASSSLAARAAGDKKAATTMAEIRARGARATGSRRLLDEDAGWDALGPLPDLRRA